MIVSLSEYICRFLVDIRGEHTFTETADMSMVFGFAYGSEVAACRSYQDAVHTHRVRDKEKSVTLTFVYPCIVSKWADHLIPGLIFL